MNQIVSVLSKKSNIIKQLQKILPNLQFHNVDDPEKDDQFKRSEIIIADYDLIAPYIYDLTNVKWIQGTWAGIEPLIKCVKLNEFPTFPITRFTGHYFGNLMSEYVIANIINRERGMFNLKKDQEKCQWIRQDICIDHRALMDLTIGIMGVGSIGARIAKSLQFMGASILGYGKKPTIDLSRYSHLTKYFSSDNLATFLTECDYIINVLPDTIETRGLLDGNILENCKEKGAVFVNIGRGTIISEANLLEALNQKWLSGAILDVFIDEPLPSSSPLWTMSNVFITPHVAGVTRSMDLAKQFKENLKLFQSNLPIPATVDFVKGY